MVELYGLRFKLPWLSFTNSSAGSNMLLSPVELTNAILSYLSTRYHTRDAAASFQQL
jgi:hypothetical protein